MKPVEICSVKHPLRLLDPRQFHSAAEVEDRQHRWLASQDQSLQDQWREPCQPNYATYIAVGDAFLSGEIGDGGDVAALQPAPPVLRTTDGAEEVGNLAAFHCHLDLLGKQDAGAAAAIAQGERYVDAEGFGFCHHATSGLVGALSVAIDPELSYLKSTASPASRL